MGLLAQSVSESKKAEDKPARERMKRKSSSEDVVPYHGLRVVMFENKKHHIVHCGKCLGKSVQFFVSMEERKCMVYII